MMLTPETSFNGWHANRPASATAEVLIADRAFERQGGQP